MGTFSRLVMVALVAAVPGSAHGQQLSVAAQGPELSRIPATVAAEPAPSAGGRTLRPLPPVVPDYAESRWVRPVGHLNWAEPQPPRMASAIEFIHRPLDRSAEAMSLTAHSALAASSGDTCGVACDSACDSCGSADCCNPVWSHRTGMFGEYLFLRARNADVAYAVPVDGGIAPPIPAPPPVQLGPVAVADPQGDSGFRVGGTWALDCMSSVTFSYTNFHSNVRDVVSTGAPLALRPLVLHPQTATSAADFLDITANNGVDFQLIDIDYRAAFLCDQYSVLNYLVGIRYAEFDQDFSGVFTNAGTTEVLDANVGFEGLGVRLGLDGERHMAGRGWFVYGRTAASFIAGESSGAYVQTTLPAAPTVDTAWRAGRLVTILELELGGGWQSCCGRYRLTAGYQINSWQDLVTADQFIQGVQQNDFVDMSDSITFDGLTARFEYRF